MLNDNTADEAIEALLASNQQNEEDDDNSLNSRTEELFENESLRDMPHVSEDSDEDTSMIESSAQEVQGTLKVEYKGNSGQKMKRKT